jgi:hypothetical protein
MFTSLYVNMVILWTYYGAYIVMGSTAALAVAALVVGVILLKSEPDPLKDVKEMLDCGFELACGRHLNARGYFASFFEADDNGDQTFFDRDSLDWWDAGHALTPDDAIVMAARICRGEQNVCIPGEEAFR